MEEILKTAFDTLKYSTKTKSDTYTTIANAKYGAKKYKAKQKRKTKEAKYNAKVRRTEIQCQTVITLRQIQFLEDRLMAIDKSLAEIKDLQLQNLSQNQWLAYEKVVKQLMYEKHLIDMQLCKNQCFIQQEEEYNE